ncbi:MAG: hypothetical protein ACM3S2_03335 [Ignavibacteriales bacterium]
MISKTGNFSSGTYFLSSYIRKEEISTRTIRLFRLRKRTSNLWIFSWEDDGSVKDMDDVFSDGGYGKK